MCNYKDRGANPNGLVRKRKKDADDQHIEDRSSCPEYRRNRQHLLTGDAGFALANHPRGNNDVAIISEVSRNYVCVIWV